MASLGSLVRVEVHAAQIDHDPTGNLTAILATPGMSPTLPAGSPVPIFTKLGHPLNLVTPTQSKGATSYQWFHEGGPVSDATNDVLLRPITTLADAGQYSLAVRNAYGASTGKVAQVNFTPGYENFWSIQGLVFAGEAKHVTSSIKLGAPYIYSFPGVGRVYSSRNGAAWFSTKLFCRNGFTAKFQYRMQRSDSANSPALFLGIQNTDTNFAGNESPFFGPDPRSTFGTGFGTWIGDDDTLHSVEIRHDGLNITTTVDGVVTERNTPVPLDDLLDSMGYGWVGIYGGAWGDNSRYPNATLTTTIVSWSFTPHSELSLTGAPTAMPKEPMVQIVANPTSQAVLEGETVYMKADAISGFDRYFFDPPPGTIPLINPMIGDGRLRYQWYADGFFFSAGVTISNGQSFSVLVPVGTNATLVLPNVRPSQAGHYTVAVYNHAGEVTENLLGWQTNSLAVLLPMTNLFNSGLNDNHQPIPQGTVDPRWRLLPGSGDKNPALIAQYISGWLPSDTNSVWLVPASGASPAAASTYRYQTWFWLQPWEAASAIIRGRWSAALQGSDILINDRSTSQGTYEVPYPHASSAFHSFQISRGFVAGSNSLTFVVTNAASAQTGVRVEFVGSTVMPNANFAGDSDMDGFLDAFEWAKFGNLGEAGTDDFDGDGVSNQNEVSEATDPSSAGSFRPRLIVDVGTGYVLREPNIQNYALGSVVTLTAVPPAGGAFTGWNGDLVGQQNPATFIITSNMTVRTGYGFTTNMGGWPVPGLIEAENFDEGGEGVGYHDSDVLDHDGGIYRQSSVDIVNGGTGYQVGWIVPGEWLNYTINVASNGIYRVVLRAASGSSGGTARLDFPADSQSIFVAVPGTGGYQSWLSVTSSVVRLRGGTQVMRLEYTQGAFDLDWINVLGVETGPYGGLPWPMPGIVQAEDFDTGGEGAGYHDSDFLNHGDGAYRDTAVDVVPGSTGYQVGWSVAGEWMNYSINVASNGIYRAVLRASSGASGGIGRLNFGGSTQSNSMAIPATGGWQNYISVTSAPIRLVAGPQVMQFAFEQAGFDLDSIQVFASSSLPPTVAITSPQTGQTFVLGVDIPLAVSASDSDGSVARVEYDVNDVEAVRSEATPFSASWRPSGPGAYVVRARAIDNLGIATTSADVTVRVEPFVLGMLKREVYTNVPGTLIADLTNHIHFMDSPDRVEQLWQFESPPNSGDNFGARLSGWLLPRTTGNYRFYVSSDDQGALFLSTDSTPANKARIALEPQWNGYREYLIGANQPSRGIPPLNISSNISLIAGRAYYVEALMKEGSQGDHLSVAWLSPGGLPVINQGPPIYGRYLASGTPPTGPFRLVSAVSLTNSSRITVCFERPVESLTALERTNYLVTGATVTGAALAPDPRMVLLVVAGLTGSTFELRVRNIADAFGNPISPDSATVGLVVPQSAQDIGTAGDPLEPGFALPCGSGDLVVSAGGSDIWGKADHFHFIHEKHVGDFDLQVRIESLEAVNRWSKAGLMVRESLEAGSRNLMAGVLPSGPTRDGESGGQGENSYFAQFRPAANVATESWGVSGAPLAAPTQSDSWVRLKRQGSTFTAYRATSSTSWTLIAKTNQTYPSAVYVGLATASHNNTRGFTAMAHFQDYRPVGVNPPVFTAVQDQTVVLGHSLLLMLNATDVDLPPQPLTFALVSGPTGMTVSSDGTLSWIPTATQSSSTNVVRVSVSDGGLSVTNQIKVVVVDKITTVPPILRLSPLLADGRLGLDIFAPVGTQLIVETTTDLISWSQTHQLAGLGGGSPVQVTLTLDSLVKSRFWRVRIRE